MKTPRVQPSPAQWQRLTRQELFWTGLLFGLVTLIPTAVFWNHMPCSDDTLTHFYRVVQIDLNLKNGAPWLQWGPDFLRGYGYNVLAFYAPLSYWLVELIHLSGFDFGAAFQISSVFALWLAGWGGYVLARQFLTPLGSFVAGLAYLFAPYLLYDAIQRGTLPETLALAVAPWALAAALHALAEPTPRHIGLASFLFGLLILAHNVVPIFALGLLVLLSLVAYAGSSPNFGAGLFSHWRPLLLILGFSLGITLFFWLPALVELENTQSRQAQFPFRQWPSYEQHILPVDTLVEIPDDPADPNLLNPPVVRALGLAQTILGLVGIAALIWVPKSVQRRRLVILALVSLTAVYLSSEPSLWWWQHVRLLNFIHLPVRFLGLASLGLALFCGVAVDQGVRWFSKKWQTAVLVVLASLAVSLSGWPWLYPQYCPVPQQTTRLMLAQSTTWQRWFAEAQAETLPRWVQELPPENGLMAQYEAGGSVNRLVMPESATLLAWQNKPAHDTYELDLKATTPVTYRTFFFPGWRAAVDGQSVPITPSAPQGLITVTVPAGQHTLDIYFAPTPLRLVTFIISLLIAIGLILWLWRSPNPRAKNVVDASAEASAEAFKKSLPLLVFVVVFLIVIKFIIVDNSATPIRADRLQAGNLAGAPYPTHINFGNEILHLGYKGEAEFAADETIHLTQYWTPLRPLGVPYGLDLQLVDHEGQVWHTEPGRPFSYAHYPATDSWEVGKYVRDAYAFDLLPGTPPGTYWLETAVFRRDTDLSLLPTGGAVGSSPDRARLGSIQITPGKWHLTADTAQVDTYEPTPVTAVPGLTLLGWTVPDVVWQPGQEAEVDLLWTASQIDITGPPAPVLRLTAANGNQAAQTARIEPVETAVPLGGSYPLSDWQDGAVVRDKVQWRLPPDLESGEYTVWLSSGEQDIELGQWQIDAPERTFEPPKVDITSSFQVDFGKLVGYSLAETATSAGSGQATSAGSGQVGAPGSAIDLTLFWQATAETPTNYRVFVHLLDENGRLVAQSDAVPDNWTRPTTGWVPGEYIHDRHTLTPPADAAPGDYTLVIGFYETATGSRLGEAEIGRVRVSGG